MTSEASSKSKSQLLQQKVEIFPERTKLDLKEVCQQHLLIEKKKKSNYWR